MGTFGGALEARQIDASDGKLTADVTGEVEQEEGVLVIRRIHVSMRLVAPEGAKEKVERVHEIYPMHCPPFSHPARCDPANILCRVGDSVGPQPMRTRLLEFSTHPLIWRQDLLPPFRSKQEVIINAPFGSGVVVQHGSHEDPGIPSPRGQG